MRRRDLTAIVSSVLELEGSRHDVTDQQGPNGWPLEGGSRPCGRRRRSPCRQRLRRKLVQWGFIHDHRQRFSPCHHSGGEYVVGAASKDGFHAWDRVSRRRLWHRQLTPALSKHQSVAGPTNGPEGGPVATDGRRIYVLSNDAAHNSCVAAALAPATGRVLWRRRLSSFSFAAPAVAGDRLFVSGADGTLRGLTTSTGKLVAAVPLGAPSTGAPAVAEGRLVVGAGAEPFLLPGHLLVCIGGHRSRTGSSK
jgi:hypothetical protein